MAEFWHMGGYAFYVWSSYGLAALVLLVNALLPLLRRRWLQREIAGGIRRARRVKT